MRFSCIFAILAALCMPAHAQRVGFGEQGQHVAVIKVGSLIASPGESDERFLLRAGSTFRDFTAVSGFEACAQLCHSPEGLAGLLITTNNSHIGCAVVDRCPLGMLPSGLTVHSHPQQPTYLVNEADRVFLAARHPEQAIGKRSRRTVSTQAGFSLYDYQWGPGYLVDGDLLRYQEGRKSTRIIGSLPPPLPSSP